MPQVVSAVYENGVLRPLEPLALKERETVEVEIRAERSWDEEFDETLRRGRSRAHRFTPEEIEADITEASREVREMRRAAQGRD